MASFVLALLVMSNTYAPVTRLEFDRGAVIVVPRRPQFEPLVRAPGGHALPKRARPSR